jgi:hypothetical protein
MSAGLFPSLLPGSRVYCPSHFFPKSWIARPLSTIKLLRLYQLPLSFNGVLGGLDPAKGLPFEDSPAADLFASIFHQLWGVIGGGLGGEGEEVKVNDPNKSGKGEDVEGGEEEMHTRTQEEMEEIENLARPPHKPERVMTVKRPEIHLVEEGGGASTEGGVC